MKISRTLRSILVFIAVILTAILSWIGFAKLYPGEGFSFSVERFFRMVKVFLGDPIGNAVENKDLPWELIVAKIFAGFIVIGGIFKVAKTLFFEQYTLLNILFKNRHVISVGINEKGKRILNNLKHCEKQNGVAIELKKDHPNEDKLRREGHLIVSGDARDQDILQEAGIKKAKYFICFLRNEQTTLETARSIREFYTKNNIKNKLECFLHLDNPRLIEMMQASTLLQNSSDGLSFRLFNTHRMIARNFFSEFPSVFFNEIHRNKRFRIVIFGFGDTGQQILMQALRVLHFPGKDKVEFLILDENIERKREIFEGNHPKISKIAEVRFLEFNGVYQQFVNEFPQGENVENVVICTFENDRQNLEASLEILNATPAQNFRIFALNSSSENMNNIFVTSHHQRIVFFGNLNYICKVELITREKQDTLAKAIHNDYLALQKELAVSESAAYKTPWEELSEDAKNANRAQADHIIYKLAILGKDLKNLNNVSFTPEETELLAITEHERWNAHRYSNGWDFGEKRDDLHKLHPSLIPWEALPEGEKQKDRDTILRIPKILKTVDSLEI